MHAHTFAGNNMKFLQKAATLPVRRRGLRWPARPEGSNASVAPSCAQVDTVVLDLEDAVAPSQKAEARRNIAAALQTITFPKRTEVLVCVRVRWRAARSAAACSVTHARTQAREPARLGPGERRHPRSAQRPNQAARHRAAKGLPRALGGGGVIGGLARRAQVESPEHVRWAAQLMEHYEAIAPASTTEAPRMALVALVESGRAVLDVWNIVNAHPTLQAVIFGQAARLGARSIARRSLRADRRRRLRKFCGRHALASQHRGYVGSAKGRGRVHGRGHSGHRPRAHQRGARERQVPHRRSWPQEIGACGRRARLTPCRLRAGG
jgi:hypothetical protein